jgi:C-terminal processing protease CtpA/Prc
VKALIAKDANAKKLCRDPRHALREASATIVFDLPHGRVWYSPEELAAPDYKNTSGLTLNYTYIKGDRALVVQSIQPKSVASQLEKAGLKKGMVVTEIDELPTLEMDLWEVNRRLAGVYGDTVKLQWQTQKGFQVEPLRVLERQIRNP